MTKKVAIIGGGIFGVTIATNLSKKIHVDLYEEREDILMCASRINQFRLHRGYHYPRSSSTVLSCLKTEPVFRRMYSEAIIKSNKHYYCIANEGSLTSPQKFKNFCNEYGLWFKEEDSGLTDNRNISLSVRVKEYLMDYDMIRKISWKRLNEKGVKVMLNKKVDDSISEDYDVTILCGYAGNNSFFKKNSAGIKDLQYELCEKIIVKMPREFNGKSIVVLDGEFMCIDPMGSTGYHLLGNVRHAIHKRNIGKYPTVPSKLKDMLNQKKPLLVPELSKFSKFIASGKKIIPGFEKAIYKGSLFTFRTVLPNKERTDERPTVIEMRNRKIITVLAGKISGSVEALERVKKELS